MVKGETRFLMRKKVSVGGRAELNFASGVLQIKSSSGRNLRREPTKEENLLAGKILQRKNALGAFRPRADRSACGKVPHVALARWDSFDEGVCGCFAGALQARVTKLRMFHVKRFRINQK